MSHLKDRNLPLGRETTYLFEYNAALLCPIPRSLSREAAGIPAEITYRYGEDIWNGYELSWLSLSGKPEIAMAEIRVPAESPCLIESKSLKLYFNSFNMTQFADIGTVESIIARDLSAAAETDVKVQLRGPEEFSNTVIAEPDGICIDDQPVGDFVYTVNPALLATGSRKVQQTLFSRLFRSCCPVTGQPDWATVTVNYSGRMITADSLLRYLVSFREHSGFHESCVEKIYCDILSFCSPEELLVSARFTRRGGIDINPIRSTRQVQATNLRDPRQ